MNEMRLRRYPRLNVKVPVNYTAGEESYRCVAITLSGGGLFLANVAGLAPGVEISLRFRPAKHLPIIQAKASVRYVVTGEGAAVTFTEIVEEDRNKLLRLIHQRTADRRVHPRAPLATQVQCEECMTLAFSRDISVAGMFIETSAPLDVGTPFTVRFNLDQKDRVIKAEAIVNYVIEKMGMGVLFTEVEPPDRDAIKEYIASTPDLDEGKPVKTGSA
ncbi:MAG: PilZ domain-containing protein [Terriglobia bacterium]